MAMERSKTLRRIVAAAAIGFVLTSPALLAGCDVTADPGPAGGIASAAQASPSGSAKTAARSSIISFIINTLVRERDSNRDVIRNL